MTQKQDELIGSCPFHKESKPSFHVSLVKNAFQCFGCGAKGNILDFVQKKESVTLREAALLIQEWFDPSSGGTASPGGHKEANKGIPETKPAPVAPEVNINPALTFSLKLDPSHSYLKERGLTPETINHFGLGFCGRGLLKDRIAIPIHDEKGNLVAYAGRWPGDPPEGEEKYMLPPGFKKRLVLFNLHRAIKEAGSAGSIIIVEGFFACFRLWQAGYKNVVALMGRALSPEQEELLISLNKKIVLMLDQDEPGQKATQEILPRLVKHSYVKVVELPSEGDQPDRLSEETLQQILA
jgi:DNA primase